jgi:hypothetical protein
MQTPVRNKVLTPVRNGLGPNLPNPFSNEFRSKVWKSVRTCFQILEKMYANAVGVILVPGGRAWDRYGGVAGVENPKGTTAKGHLSLHPIRSKKKNVSQDGCL